ncbi:pyocin activator PrtN family protein [Vibrio rotiferianus]|uniref:pyocin activator PrtN family protein n=1 Tax=Vibrio rotiferianus TaxID=190895 RepID=UPI00148C17E5|nr:pyocin activator PrtN family protein [Vibrio rotiferianus]NOH68742.1 pyocin activator protein PrtN [Vibrio rotiferianus]
MRGNTAFALYARFGKSEIYLSDICEEYFGINIKTAQQKARTYELPIPVFRMDESQRAPYLVKAEDLAEFIDKKHERAREEWLMVRGTNH